MQAVDSDGILDVDDLPDEIAPASDEGDHNLGEATGADGLIGKALTDVEKYYIQRALELTDGKRDEAAAMLGIGERTLYRKIKEYELKTP
jgi:two-component system response regulator HydG